MKIKIDYNNTENETLTLNIVEAIYYSNYKINLKFNDGIVTIVDFETFLLKSQHPSINKYLDLKLFKDFKIIDGNLNWNDYDLIFPIWELYQGKIG